MARDRDLTWAREQRERDAAILRAYVDSMIDDQRMKVLRATRTRRARPLAWALLGAIVCVYLAALAASAGGC